MSLDAPTVRAVTADRAMFETDIVPAGKPVILKGLAAGWPAIAAARTSMEALGDHLRRHDSRRPVSVSVCPNSEKGRFFYNEDLSGLNYVTGQQTLSNLVGWCPASQHQANPDAVYL